MDVDVDLGGIDVEEDERHRVVARDLETTIPLADRVLDLAITDRSAVEKAPDAIVIATVLFGPTEPPPHPVGTRQFDEIGAQIGSEDLCDTVPMALVGGIIEDHPVVVKEPETDGGERHRDRLDGGTGPGNLGRIGLEEASAGRDGEEEVPDDHPGAMRERKRRRRFDTPLRGDHPAGDILEGGA